MRSDVAVAARVAPGRRGAGAHVRRTAGADPHSGATVPAASALVEGLKAPAISLPIVNFDNNQHGENENLRLGHLFTGIVSIAAVLTM